MHPARIARIAYRELWQQRLPHGLLSWRYLNSNPAECIRLHRALWWRSGARWPRTAWLLVQAWLWLRWVLCLVWLDAARALARHGRDARELHGIGRTHQFFRLLRLGLGWCIPPASCYHFGVVRAPARALGYVYEQELPAFHQWRSGPPGAAEAAHGLLRDKLALAEELDALEIPVVSTLACVAKGAPGDTLSARLPDAGPVFCKSRSGHGGFGAFTAWRTHAGLVGRCLDGRPLPDTAAVEDAWRGLLRQDDALFQPCLTNHPALAPLAEGDDAITVRYISRWRGAEPACLCALLELPAGLDPESGRTRYCILPIDTPAGRPRAWPPHAYLSAADRHVAREALARMDEGLRLPDWPALVAWSHRAQARFPDCWAIAWDWVLTPSGPVLLEGNPGWGTAIPQMIHGGFLDCG